MSQTMQADLSAAVSVREVERLVREGARLRLAGMVDDEMLVSYELDVTATRDEEIRGIARVTMTVRPTFSIDFIKVVMFLG